jgi:hypothetical protein
MKLEEFIEESLKQIICGVKKAQDATRLADKHPQEAALVNPGDIMYSADSAPKGKYFATVGRDIVHFVDFDVAVTTDYKDEAKGGIGLKVFGIGIEGGGAIVEGGATVSRIKFQVPIILPRYYEK